METTENVRKQQKTLEMSELKLVEIWYMTLIHASTATSVDVERLFSRGQFLLNYTRSQLSVLSTRSLLCLGSWSLLDLVRTEDVKAVMKLNEVEGQIELQKLREHLRKFWNSIV